MDKFMEETCFYGPKNVRYFHEVGKKRAFFGKKYGKKKEAMCWYVVNYGIFSHFLGKSLGKPKNKEMGEGSDGTICGNSPHLSVCERGFLP